MVIEFIRRKRSWSQLTFTAASLECIGKCSLELSTVGCAFALVHETIDIVLEKTFWLENFVQVHTVVFGGVNGWISGPCHADEQQHSNCDEFHVCLFIWYLDVFEWYFRLLLLYITQSDTNHIKLLSWSNFTLFTHNLFLTAPILPLLNGNKLNAVAFYQCLRCCYLTSSNLMVTVFPFPSVYMKQLKWYSVRGHAHNDFVSLSFGSTIIARDSGRVTWSVDVVWESVWRRWWGWPGEEVNKQLSVKV